MKADTLLETKLHLPIAHGRPVPRARLSDQLAGATAATLTLVSAPDGFGKTTLIAELASRPDGARIAWLSLDAGDNDPVTFWTYVVEAIDRAAPGLMTGARSSLAASQVSVDAVVTALLNGLVAAEADVVLVLDDLHVIESPAINEQLGYFLEHLPARGHVVAGTRADPAIPLARLRARGGLVEIRASDLRFSPAEAARYLESMGLVLADGDVDLLEGRTEGWIAALQLAALSLRGRDDTTAFISAFAGDDRHIVDYLVEEVLRRQPARVRDFLLKTSILSRFTGSLADSVTAGEDGAATIEALDRANLFVVALDSQRRWYRYHHLFGGVLQAHLAAEMPAEVAILHRRASDWFDEHGDRPTAVEHAFRAGDPERTAELVELAAVEMRQYRREATLRAWIAALPRDVIARRPNLAVGLAGSTLSANQVEGVDELLTGAERLLAAGEPLLILDEAERRRLPAMIELYRAALCKLQGDFAGNVAHARRVLELGDPDDDIGRGGAETFLGLAAWGMGDLDEGYAWYEKGMASLERGGLLTDVVGAGMIGADIRVAAGRLTDAMRIYEDGLARATRTQPPLRGATDMHTGLAEIAYQRGRLDEAQAHIEEGRRLGDQLGFPREPYRWRLVRARVLQAQGDIDAALPLLAEAERLYLSEFSPDIHPIPAIRARMLVAHVRTGEARAWANRAGLLPTDELTYVREYEHLTLARLLVAEATDGRDAALPEALALLERLLMGAENGRRDGSRLEILVVQALARHAAGDGAGAFTAIDGAIELGEREGYVRVFLDEGAPMTRLLKAAAKRSRSPGYVHELVRASTAATGAAGPSLASPALVEQLSEREVEVLRLLRSDLDGPGMARELVVSLNTLRSHTKNIYAKLGVGSRRAAVRRGEELDLI